MTQLLTSLAEIKSFDPCGQGWKNILKGQGKAREDEELFPLSDCLKSNTFANVCWLLGKRKTELSVVVRAARLCADSVQHYKNIRAVAAADYAIYAADCATDATDAAESVANYATSAAASATHAAATYATNADFASFAAVSAANVAADAQVELNKQFMLQAIQEFEKTEI